MRGLLIRPFTSDDLPGAAALLAERHRRHRVGEPLLGVDFASPAVAGAHLREVWDGDRVSSTVAVRDGAVLGYLLAGAKEASTWGDNAWVDSAGHALGEGVDAEVARELYAGAAAAWVGAGRRAHYVVVPSHDHALVDAWWRLGFGVQHVHAVREPAEPVGAPGAGSSGTRVVVRRAERRDLPALAELDLLLTSHHGGSPVFSRGPTDTFDEALAEWERDFDSGAGSADANAIVVADRGGRVVGTARGCALTVSRAHTGPARPPGAGFLSFAAVRSEERGTGVGRALVGAVLGWSAARGDPAVVTDWRAANLQAARAWTSLGFRPTFWRLHRVVGR